MAYSLAGKLRFWVYYGFLFITTFIATFITTIIDSGLSDIKKKILDGIGIKATKNTLGNRHKSKWFFEVRHFGQPGDGVVLWACLLVFDNIRNCFSKNT